MSICFTTFHILVNLCNTPSHSWYIKYLFAFKSSVNCYMLQMLYTASLTDAATLEMQNYDGMAVRRICNFVIETKAANGGIFSYLIIYWRKPTRFVFGGRENLVQNTD